MSALPARLLYAIDFNSAVKTLAKCAYWSADVIALYAFPPLLSKERVGCGLRCESGWETTSRDHLPPPSVERILDFLPSTLRYRLATVYHLHSSRRGSAHLDQSALRRSLELAAKRRRGDRREFFAKRISFWLSAKLIGQATRPVMSERNFQFCRLLRPSVTKLPVSTNGSGAFRL